MRSSAFYRWGPGLTVRVSGLPMKDLIYHDGSGLSMRDIGRLSSVLLNRYLGNSTTLDWSCGLPPPMQVQPLSWSFLLREAFPEDGPLSLHRDDLWAHYFLKALHHTITYCTLTPRSVYSEPAKKIHRSILVQHGVLSGPKKINYIFFWPSQSMSTD